LIALAAALGVIVLDQITKAAITGAFARGDGVSVIGEFLRIGHAQNSGAVFGIMKSAGRFFTVFSVVAAVVLVATILVARRAPVWVRVGLGLVLGGAVGNLVDRIRFGAVVDFIDIGINDSVRWPSFNVADAAITVGIVLLLAASLRPAKPRPSPGDQGVAL
jgi:signal peptidase II